MAKKAAKETPRQPIDFNQAAPPLAVTDPDRFENESHGIPVDREYPKHVHRFFAVGQAHEYREVHDADEEAAAKREGFGTAQEADAVGRRAQAGIGGADAPAAPKAPKVKKAAAPKKKKSPVSVN